MSHLLFLKRIFFFTAVTGICLLQLTSCRPPAPSYARYGYLIVSPKALMPVMQAFVEHKIERGFIVQTVSLEEILILSQGDDDPEKIRNYLRDYASLTPNREFVLLVGSMDTLPMRIAYPDPDDHSPWAQVPTDFYYEELTGTWDGDGDGFFGEYGHDMNKDTEDYIPELHVGRIPWDEPDQIHTACEAIMLYEQDTSPRMKHALGAAATIFQPCDITGLVNVARHLVLKPAGYQTTALYENCPSANPDLDLTRDNFLGMWEALEPGFVIWFSHGNEYGSYYNEDPYTFIDVDHIPRDVAPAVGVTSGCIVGAPDTESLGRVLVREGVCASFLGSSRITFYGDDNPFPAFLSIFAGGVSFIWDRPALSEAKAVAMDYFVKNERVPENLEGWCFHQNLFQFMVFGDPSIQLR